MALVGPEVTMDPEAQVGRWIRLTAGRTGTRVQILAARRRGGWLEIDIEVPAELTSLFDRTATPGKEAEVK